MPQRVAGRKASSRGLKRSHSSDASPNTSREASISYASARYDEILEQRGSFLEDSTEGLSKESQLIISTLLDTKQVLPRDTLFKNGLFETVCQKARRMNEARIVHDITPLIIPSAEELAARGKIQLQCLIDSFNERWTNCLPFLASTPQPDVAVGFAKDAFTTEQFAKLSFLAGDYLAGDQTHIMATYRMFFPFLTCEVKSSNAALETADRQNAHSMTVAARALVHLHQHCGLEARLAGKVLGFSISHNHEMVHLCAHYVAMKSSEATYHRRTIRKYSFTALNGRERWVSYSFVKSIYELWVPNHLNEIRSLLDQLPVGSGSDAAVPLDESSQAEEGWRSQSSSDAEPSSRKRCRCDK